MKTLNNFLKTSFVITLSDKQQLSINGGGEFNFLMQQKDHKLPLQYGKLSGEVVENNLGGK